MHVVRIASWLDDPWLFAIFIGLFVRAQYELLFSLSILVVFPTSPIVLPIRQFVYPICLSFQSVHLSSQSSLPSSPARQLSFSNRQVDSMA